MKAILLGPESYPHLPVLQRKLTTHWELVGSERSRPDDALRGEFDSCQVLISIRFDGSLPPMPALKLVQAPSAGVNSIQLDAVPAHIPVCNAYGHEIAVAEYCVLAMLACARQLLTTHARFAAGEWRAAHKPYAEVAGKTVCIVGLGRIGLLTAHLAKAVGMRVIGCNRTPKRSDDLDEVVGLTAVNSAVARADYVIVAAALAEETRNLLDRNTFDAMKPEAFLINVARSGLIVEADLFRALSTRRIAGAVLDVWYRYPTENEPRPAPSAFPFNDLDNVIMTPHVSGWTDGMIERRWSQIAANLDALALGQPLANVVRAGA